MKSKLLEGAVLTEEQPRAKRLKAGLAALTILITVLMMMSLTACSSGTGGTNNSASGVSAEDRTNAKQVVMAAGDMFTIVNLGLTNADSPVVISQSDSAYAEFFSQLQTYKKVADLEVSDITITASIQAIGASTAREDVQTNYRYTISEVVMTINGTTITYNTSSGFSY